MSRRVSRPPVSTGRRCRRLPATTRVRARRCWIRCIRSDWILAVADVAAQFKLDLSRIEEGPAAKPGGQGITPIRDIRRQLESEAVRAERVNIVRVADIRLQRADPEYATRAGSNNAHFLLARPTRGPQPL